MRFTALLDDLKIPSTITTCMKFDSLIPASSSECWLCEGAADPTVFPFSYIEIPYRL